MKIKLNFKIKEFLFKNKLRNIKSQVRTNTKN